MSIKKATDDAVLREATVRLKRLYAQRRQLQSHLEQVEASIAKYGNVGFKDPGPTKRPRTVRRGAGKAAVLDILKKLGGSAKKEAVRREMKKMLPKAHPELAYKTLSTLFNRGVIGRTGKRNDYTYSLKK